MSGTAWRRAGDYITGKIGGGQAKPWQLWLARYRRIIEATVVGIAVLVLIFWQDPTAAVAIWTAVLAGWSFSWSNCCAARP